jgi:hypothetical protein
VTSSATSIRPSSLHVLGMGKWFEMGRTHTGSTPTTVIQLISVWNRTYDDRVDDPVGRLIPSAPPDIAVSIAVLPAGPFPAPVASDDNTRQQIPDGDAHATGL